MRIVAEDVAVLAGAGLALIGIDDEIGRPVALLFGMNDHLSPVGKPAPPRPRRPGLLDLVDDPVAALEDQLLGAVPIAARARAGEPPIVLAVEVGEDAVLVGAASRSRPPASSGKVGQRASAAVRRRALAPGDRARRRRLAARSASISASVDGPSRSS